LGGEYPFRQPKPENPKHTIPRLIDENVVVLLPGKIYSDPQFIFEHPNFRLWSFGNPASYIVPGDKKKGVMNTVILQ